MKRFIKRLSLKSLCIVFSALCFIAVNSYAADTGEVNGIAAIVNDQVITDYDVNQQVAFFTKQIKASKTQLPPEDVLRKQVLQHMIDNEVQIQIAEKTGIRVSNSQVTNAIIKLAKQKGMTKEQLYQQMQKAGLTAAEYREQVKNELIGHQLIQREVATRIHITDEQVKMFKQSQLESANENTSYQLGDILIALPDSPSTEQVQAAKKRATELLARINSGKTTFEKAAISESDNTDALKGGDLGFRKYSELPTLFAKQVVTMKAGDIAGPLRAGNGFHLLKLVSVKSDANAKPLTDEQIKQALFNRKLYSAMDEWLAKNRAQAYIKIMPQ